MVLEKSLVAHRESEESRPSAPLLFGVQWTTDSVIPIVFLMAVGTMFVIASAEWTLLLYLNHVGFTHPNDSSFYIFTFAMALVVPLAGNIVLGVFASRIGPGRTLAWGYLFVAFGMVLLLFSRSSKTLFLIAYCMYASCMSFRIIRLSIISDLVSPKNRTAAMAGHLLMAPIGAILSPLLLLLLQSWQGRFTFFNQGFVVDRFTLNYSISCLVMLCMGKLAFEKLKHLGNEGGNMLRSSECEPSCGSSTLRYGIDKAGYGAVKSQENKAVLLPDLPSSLTIRLSDGREEQVFLNQYQYTRFVFFCAVLLGVHITMGIFKVAFQPILVNNFGAQGADVAKIFAIVAVAALIPPLVVAAVSTLLEDRQILLFGLALKLVGMVMYLPIFGSPVREWQVVLGFVLIIKSSMFCTTASISLLTKVLGKMSSSTLLGYMWSIVNIGPAVVQIMLSTKIVEYFGGWQFAIFTIPALLSVSLVLSPMGWKLLDPQSEVTRLVLASIDQDRHANLKRTNLL